MVKETRSYGALLAVLVTVALISFTVHSILGTEPIITADSITGLVVSSQQSAGPKAGASPQAAEEQAVEEGREDLTGMEETLTKAVNWLEGE